MWNRFLCPSCKGDLKKRIPTAYPHKWHRLVFRHTLKCPYCNLEIMNRFENFDIGLSIIATSSGLISVWTVGKVVLPILVVIIALRFFIGKVVPKYILVVK